MVQRFTVERFTVGFSPKNPTRLGEALRRSLATL